MENIKMLFGLATFSITILAYGVLDRGIILTKGRGQNFFTWLLWSILDIILYIKINEEDGLAKILVLACVVGSLSTSILLFKNKKKWTNDETRTLYFIIILIPLLFFSNSARVIIIFAVISELVAGWPLLKETWKNPDDSGYTLTSYLIFLLGYILTIVENFVLYPTNEVFGDKFVENMLFPLAFIVYSVFDTVPLIRIWLKK